MAKRQHVNPAQYGVALTWEQFIQVVVESFNKRERDTWAVDEFLIHPYHVIAFCDNLKIENGWEHCPVEVILRALITARKSPRKGAKVSK